jgi:hypothetical protein
LNRHHHFRFEQVQRECCENAAHWKWRITCSCGWTEHVMPEGDRDRTIMLHRLQVLEQCAGIRVSFGEPQR